MCKHHGVFNTRVPFLIFLLVATPSCAQTTNPALLNVVKPSPEPSFPAGFDPFVPPVTPGLALAGTPAIAEWTKTGKPDAVVALTGSRFSTYTADAAGKDTQFQVFGQGVSGSFSGPASILRLDGFKAAVILPAGLPANSEYLIWPVNSVGAGNPVAVNATEAWWVGPNVATRGDTVSVFGRNLAHNGKPVTSYIYIQKSGLPGIWANVTAANPYKVDFTVPASLANGTYQVWAHNGHGGHYGWSGPLTLTINNGTPWTAQTFNVKSYGAKGDGVTDDEAAIQTALDAAARAPWSTLYFPTGTYMISKGFLVSPQIRWLGDGSTHTFIKANAGFVAPQTYDARMYSMLYGFGGSHDVTFQGLTIDPNGLMKAVLTTPVYARCVTNYKFSDVTMGGKGYDTADFGQSTLIFLQACKIIDGAAPGGGGGNGIFFGAATQVFIDNCKIYGANDVNTMLDFFGGSDGISVTNTTAQDYDNTQQDGWAQGRFLYGASTWGSNRNFYVGDNTTNALAVRPGYANQNAGEQLLWENGTKYSGTPAFATQTTVTFGGNVFFQDAGLLNGSYDAVIVNGAGLGQHRKITGRAGSTITVSPAWNIPPDTTSTVIIAGVISQCAVYHNALQGKSDYATRDTASGGIQPFGNSYDFVADNNTISQVRTGIAAWGMSAIDQDPANITCAYFNYVANNTIHNCLNGIIGISQAWGGWPVAAPYPGITFLGNTCVGNTVDSVADSGFAEMAALTPIGDQLDLNMFDQNTVTNTPAAINLDPSSHINNAILYKNNLSLGSAIAPGSVGVSLATSATSALRQNKYIGFEKTYGGTPAPAMTIEAPTHVIPVQGTSRGAAVKASLVLWNAGTAALSWSVSNTTAWLTASQKKGSISNESGTSTIDLSCNPASLAPGVYSGTVTVTGSNQVRNYSVIFTVQAAAPFSIRLR